MGFQYSFGKRLDKPVNMAAKRNVFPGQELNS
jgi:hypothetical protein